MITAHNCTANNVILHISTYINTLFQRSCGHDNKERWVVVVVGNGEKNVFGVCIYIELTQHPQILTIHNQNHFELMSRNQKTIEHSSFSKSECDLPVACCSISHFSFQIREYSQTTEAPYFKSSTLQTIPSSKVSKGLPKLPSVQKPHLTMEQPLLE